MEKSGPNLKKSRVPKSVGPFAREKFGFLLIGKIQLIIKLAEPEPLTREKLRSVSEVKIRGILWGFLWV